MAIDAVFGDEEVYNAEEDVEEDEDGEDNGDDEVDGDGLVFIACGSHGDGWGYRERMNDLKDLI
jgi:hypothetical protein